MRPQISEFSYGYALTYELIKWPGTTLKAAPVFPSLRQEGRPGGGYDVETPYGNAFLFLQFKMSDYITTKTGKEARLGLLQPPYYRFPLTPLSTSDQHNLLRELEKTEEQVYYVAPAFHDVSDFAQLYASGELWKNSCRVRPSAIGELPDKGPHKVAFQKADGPWVGSWQAYRMSQPVPVPVVSDETFVRELSVQVEQHANIHLFEQCYRILSHLEESVIRPHLNRRDYHLPDYAQESPVGRVAHLARMVFGVETYLVSKKLDDTDVQ